MTYEALLVRIIDEGIAAAEIDYANRPDKLKGAVAGFEACRGKTPPMLAELLNNAQVATAEAHRNQVENYWEIRCFEAEVEWVCNVISASAVVEDQRIITPTAHGYMKFTEIVQNP